MTQSEVLNAVAEVIRDTFAIDDLQIDRSTTAIDVPGWDSLSHTIIILAIEDKMGVRLESAPDFDDIGALVDFIVSKLQDSKATSE